MISQVVSCQIINRYNLHYSQTTHLTLPDPDIKNVSQPFINLCKFYIFSELLPGIEEFLVKALAQEELSAASEKKRLFFIERLDIIKMPPSLPPRPPGEYLYFFRRIFNQTFFNGSEYEAFLQAEPALKVEVT